MIAQTDSDNVMAALSYEKTREQTLLTVQEKYVRTSWWYFFSSSVMYLLGMGILFGSPESGRNCQIFSIQLSGSQQTFILALQEGLKVGLFMRG